MSDQAMQTRAVQTEQALTLLVSLPALNEEKTVRDVISMIPRQIVGVRRVDVLVVDDGSTDGTVACALEAGAAVVSHERTGGVGAAFHTALAHALEQNADLLVTIDADGQFDPREIPRLIEPVLAGRADFTTASRFIDPNVSPKMPPIKRWGNGVMSRLVSRITGRQFFDVSCGMRCYTRKAMLHLNLMGKFTYTQEVFLNLAFKQMRMVEVPMAIEGVRRHGKSRVAGNLFRYALRASAIIFRCYRDYNPMRFFGRIAAALIVPALALWVFLGVHYLTKGSFTPHKWAGFTGAALLVLGLMSLSIGVIGDMLNRHRIYLEEVLYNIRKGNGR